MKAHHPLIAIASGLLVLTACGAPSTPVATSVAASAPASSAATQTGQEVDRDQLLEDVTTATQQATTYVMEMTLNSVVAGKQVAGTISTQVDQTDPDQVAMKYSMDMGGEGIEMIMVGGDTYLKMGALGEKYFKMTADQLDRVGVDTPGVGANSGLSEVRQSVTKVVFVGNEDINGVNTRHYTLTMDASAFERLGGAGIKVLDKTFDYDLWVDDANLMRKFSMSINAEGAPFEMTAIFDKYGEPVDISAPDPSMVAQLPG